MGKAASPNRRPTPSLGKQHLTLALARAVQRGGDQAQTVPARHKAIVFSALNHPVVEQRDGRQGQLGARLGERLFGDYAHQLRLVVQMRKELIEFGLNTLAHTAEHQRDQGWQGQLALAGEGVGMFGVGGVQEKFGRAYARGKIDKKREKGHVGQ